MDPGATQQIFAKDGIIVMSNCASVVGHVRMHQIHPIMRISKCSGDGSLNDTDLECREKTDDILEMSVR